MRASLRLRSVRGVGKVGGRGVIERCEVELSVLFAELRAIVQGPRCAAGWDALLGLLKRPYDAVTYRLVAEDEAALRGRVAQLEEEVLPGLRVELERRWPATLRVVPMRAPRALKALGGVLHVDLHPQALSLFLYSRGHKSSGKLTARALKILPELWFEGLQFEGMRIDHLETHHVELMATLLDAAPGALRHVRLRNVAAPRAAGASRSGARDNAPLRELVSLLVARGGQRLESYAASAMLGAQDAQTLDALYRPLIEHAASLTALRQLELPYVLHAGGPDTVGDLLREPGLARLEALRCPRGLSAERWALLAERAGSVNLRRVSLGCMSGELSALMDAPNLGGVEVWDVSQWAPADDGWETPAAAHWAALRAGGLSLEVLDAASVSLVRYDAARVEALLFEGERLRPCPRMEVLRLEAIGEGALVRLLEQGASAWPGLRYLAVERALSDAELVALVGGGLLEQLEGVDWRGDRRVPGVWHPRLSPYAAQVRDRQQVLALALDAATHPIIGYGLLQQVLETSSFGGASLSRASLERLARAMGLLKPYPEELHAAMRARFFELRGPQYEGRVHGVPKHL